MSEDIVSNEELKAIADIAFSAINTAKEIDRLEKELKDAKALHDQLTGQRLPDAMASVGLRNFTLVDGTSINVKPEYHCSIPKTKKSDAMQYLRENEFGDLIKNDLTISFGKGEDQEAEETYTALKEEFPDSPITLAESVHPSTLKSLVKEQYESGNPLPEDLFGIYIINRAVIK